jgi:hypothetical protein
VCVNEIQGEKGSSPEKQILIQEKAFIVQTANAFSGI